MISAGVDALVIDTAHAHSKSVAEALKKVKNNFNNIDVIVGNIATKEAANFLIDIGADGLKVGIGPGSICTTRIVAGVGYPQFSAVLEVAKSIKNKNNTNNNVNKFGTFNGFCGNLLLYPFS